MVYNGVENEAKIFKANNMNKANVTKWQLGHLPGRNLQSETAGVFNIGASFQRTL